jgi:hypothetical protein
MTDAQPMKTKAELIADITVQINKIKDNPDVPAWIVKLLTKRLTYIKAGTIVTPQMRIVDLHEQFADMAADPRTTPQALSEIQKAINKLEENLYK